MFENLLPTPLHPAVVHLPIALTLLVPVFAIGAIVAIRRGATVLRAWSIAAAMLGALSFSAWVALETGEDQEDKVEAVVPEVAFESHEEAAEAFFTLSLAVLGIAAVGLARGRVGSAARYTTAASTIALLVVGYNVGHSGGDLVYEHGAASAYVTSTPRTTTSSPAASHSDDDNP
jgi:formate hydrogenlyase subunit 3/multisubunit Na+/H+ antiporter MnhD subunit